MVLYNHNKETGKGNWTPDIMASVQIYFSEWNRKEHHKGCSLQVNNSLAQEPGVFRITLLSSLDALYELSTVQITL